MSPPAPDSPVLTMSKEEPHPEVGDELEIAWGVTMVCRVEQVLPSSRNPDWRRITAVVLYHKSPEEVKK